MSKVGYCKANPEVKIPLWILERCKKDGCGNYKEVEYDTLVLLQKV